MMNTNNFTQPNRWLWLGMAIGLATLLLIAFLWGTQVMATHATASAASSANPALIPSNSVITYTIRARAKGTSIEAGRISNLEEAAQRLNTQLEAQGAPYRVELQAELTNESWSDYTQRFVDDFNADQSPDIILNGHEMVGEWGAAGYVISLTNNISAEWTGTYSDFYPDLWNAVTWNGERWAVPQDTEARPVYFRKDVLQALGWSDAQISQMVADTLSGNFTLADMGDLAQKAMQAGAVEWGLFHRPVVGSDFYILPQDYGGELYNPATDHLVLSQCPTNRSLTFFYNLANVWQVTPMTMTTAFDWGTIHQTFVDGDVLFFFGGTWQWSEWRDNYLGGNEQYLWDNVGFMLYPAAHRGNVPTTLSHPTAYMISSQSEHPDIAFQILTLASAPDLVAQYSVDSTHLAVRQAATQESVYQNDAFLQSVSYMLDYTTFGPNHVQEGEYKTKLYEAISAVETGSMTPSAAMTWLETELQIALGSELEIDAPCFDAYLPLTLKDLGP
jgi:inositol-phosphate transport system substrate-binding protein